MRTTKYLPGNTSAARTFGREANSVPTARSWATRTYSDFGAAEELVGVCELLVSEVVTNAVEHGKGDEYTVVVCRDFWIEVWDESPELPQQREHALDSEGGRGLDLLKMLAPGYQVLEDSTRGGKCVRFQPKGWA
ncbi:ATP-binding protein [Streptomyces sp. NPDC058257]|uniref:ATP-binding protein n=1 Tax=Streptomyces sp. NPDC058257 TaxID=3346409 RepID=UPI0036E41FAC